MNAFTLANRTILITGASSGIGEATAHAIAVAGATVILSGRNASRLQAVLEALPGEKHRIIAADLCKEDELISLAESCPQLNGIVHSAGIVKPFPIKFIGKKQIADLFDINYHAPVTLTSKLFKLRRMESGSALVFMSSISSQFPHKGGALYAGSKAAINVYSKTVALEYAPQKIRSNVISAAMVRTPLFDATEQAITKELMDKHGEQYPLGFGLPEDIANAMVFLLSDASRWITGTELIMDGGLTTGQ